MKGKGIKKPVLNFLRRAVLGLSIIVFVFCSCFLINRYVIVPYREKQSQLETPTVDESNTQMTKITNSNNETENIQKKYEAILKANPDFVGKLKVDAVDGDYKIVQTDNNDKYLKTGWKGEYTIYGTPFVDYRNNIKDFDSNTIIYGHNMRDGSQFGAFSLYSDIENYKSFPTVEFNTIYGNYTWKIFAAFLTNSNKKDDNGYSFPYLTTNFPSDEKFLEFIDEVKSRSYFINESVDINADDKILTLSTCDTVFEGARFVIMARLVRNGESTEVDVSTAKINENQRFPQKWYDKKDMDNPFENSKRFTLN